MPRHARYRAAHVPAHVLQRGNNRCACFLDDLDRSLYLGLLRQFAPSTECDIHAYVLMTNHVHMLVTSRVDEGMSALMKAVGQRYAQHFNRKYGRSGTLWEGRFKSSLITTEDHLFRCHRYVEANPVRARMVERVVDYPWSSHAFNVLGAPSPVLLTPRPEYLAMGSCDAARWAAYKSLFATDLTEWELGEIRSAIIGGFALGTRESVKDLERRLDSRVTREVPGRPFGAR